jgi:hypothetical protein
MKFRAIPILIALLLPAPLAAQTVQYGKNKIQYSSFDWQVLSGEHIDVYYYPEEEEIARLALVYGEESYALLEQRFRHHPFRRIPLVVYSSHNHFEQTNLTAGFIPEGVLGFTEFLKRRVAIPFRGNYAQFRHTVRHELVHVFHLSRLSEVDALFGSVRGAWFPFWWQEGLAEYWSSPQDSDDEMVIRDLVLSGDLPTLKQFTYSVGFLAYPLGGSLFHFLEERFGEEHVAEIYESIWKYESFEEAFAWVYGMTMDELDREWRYSLEQKYFPLYADRPPTDVAASLIATAPSLKPQVGLVPGDTIPHLFFISPRTGFPALYETRLSGAPEPVRKVVESERRAEFQSFHLMDSRMDLSDDGVLAVVAKFHETDALFLWNLAEERVVGRYQWDDLAGMRSPAWAPDGRSVVFTGLSVRGPADLYHLDFETGTRVPLTQDVYEDDDADWSPDGRSIVFSSDRTPFGADGSKNLFVLDMDSRDISYLTYGPWKDQHPRWSHDGSRVAFSSDRSGLYEIYAVGPDGAGERISQFTGGAFDPEWLPDDESLVFTGYHDGTWQIFQYRPDEDNRPGERIALSMPAGTLAFNGVPRSGALGLEAPGRRPRGTLGGATARNGDPAAARAGGGVPAGPTPPTNGSGDSTDGAGEAASGGRELEEPDAHGVGAAAGNPATAPRGSGGAIASPGLLADAAYDTTTTWRWEELDAEINEDTESTDYSHWKSFSLDFAGGDAMIAPGLGSAQGVQFLASDMLGNHMLFASVAAAQSNGFSRLSDAFAGQLRYLNLSHRLNLGGGVFRFRGEFRDVGFNRFFEETWGGFFMASYPFSKYRRLEFQFGVERSNRYDQPDFVTPDLRADPRDLTREAVLSRNFVTYVKDNTLWLPTGPLDGERYNITMGLITDLSRARPESFVVMADYRRYIRTSMFSAIALRGFGYWSGGAIPSRAVLGGTHRLRGYPRYSLAGSRVWFLNAEWRFPLFRQIAFQLPFGNLRFPGIQGALFTDIGQSWLEGQRPEGSWGSYGVSFRMSLAYALVFRLDVGKRFAIGEEAPLIYDRGKEFNSTFVDFFFGFNF